MRIDNRAALTFLRTVLAMSPLRGYISPLIVLNTADPVPDVEIQRIEIYWIIELYN